MKSVNMHSIHSQDDIHTAADALMNKRSDELADTQTKTLGASFGTKERHSRIDQSTLSHSPATATSAV